MGLLGGHSSGIAGNCGPRFQHRFMVESVLKLVRLDVCVYITTGRLAFSPVIGLGSKLINRVAQTSTRGAPVLYIVVNRAEPKLSEMKRALSLRRGLPRLAALALQYSIDGSDPS